MIKIDLITGFLGSGKTTFIKKYASYLIEQGLRIGILENDFGAVNIDRMLLKELEGENCELEMVSGGCDMDCHRRRFKTKLIAMGMSGFDRVLVEPSGVYDIDEFFDALYEPPLDKWYEIGNVIAVVDARLEKNLSKQAEYFLASEAADAGCILLSRTQEAAGEEIQETCAHLNRSMEAVCCSRRFEKEIIIKNWEELTEKDFSKIASCGYRAEDYEKSIYADAESFRSLYYMNTGLTEEKLKTAAGQIFADPDCGTIFRIKGFVRENDQWLELNAVRQEIQIKPAPEGQDVLIVIGEGMNGEKIGKYLHCKEAVYSL